jgi:hypothetical protein
MKAVKNQILKGSFEWARTVLDLSLNQIDRSTVLAAVPLVETLPPATPNNP